jgi:hypothetical protein
MRHKFFAFVVCTLCMSFWTATDGAETIDLVVDSPISGPAQQALADFEQVLKTRSTLKRLSALPANQSAIVVGIAGQSPTVDRLLADHRISFAKQPESICIQRLPQKDGKLLLISAYDSRGLSYALLEAARTVELAQNNDDILAAIPAALETPFLRVRAMSIHPLNADLEAEWYFSEEFWQGYFKQLARNRYNNFALTFSDQTNYLNPIYAYMVDVPGFPQVQVQGQGPRERQRNLAMLKRIAELATDRGIDFTLAIWMQAPVPRYSGKVLVENLPEGLSLADYCSRGLSLILQACPAINGIQLRMNDEAGVPPEKQLEFYRPIFRAIGDCGRPMRLDLRYKGVQPATIQAARDAGLDVTISTKLWCEHFGLPYHPTEADSHYRDSRYSFGTMLAHPRPYHVLYQLWTVGSQRLLLWGDPNYAARFAQSCKLGDGEGFEVFAPLTDKGYGDAPGNWRIFADSSYEVGTWEYERYWFFYLVFGRMGYNPATNPEVWQREFRHRFGKAAADIETAYRQASQVVPLVTATQLPGASEWSWWPEIDTGGGILEYMCTQPSDTGQFYAIRAWKKTPLWRWEEWDANIPGYGDDAVAGKLRGKTTPWEVSRMLLRLADETNQSIDQAKAKISHPQSPEFRGTELDLRVLAQLARFHAAKKQAAAHLAFFELTGEAGRLPMALEQSRAAVAAWEQIVQLTDHVYHDNLVFGVTKDSPRSKMGHHHSGHWKDRLDEVRADVIYVEQLIASHGGEQKKFRRFPGETPLDMDLKLEHSPIANAAPGVDLPLIAKVSSATPTSKVILHYRRLDQTAAWNQVPMRSIADNRFEAIIPGKDISDRWDLQYYFEVLIPGGGRMWPDWQSQQPFYVVKIKPEK